MTGFSMRQIAYSLKSLTQKGFLICSTQEEDYVRNTKVEGRVEDKRIRKIHIVNPKNTELLSCCKIAPLKKYNLDNPVNTNGYKKSDLEKIRNLFKQTLSKQLISQKNSQRFC